ncbi:MAG: 6-hydroxymethylpterin diphosphokinase MptE-like protein [Promethearchaeota archaeon]
MVSSLKNNLNYFHEFKELYFQIISDFGFDYQEDCKSRNYLSQILTNKSQIWNLENVIKSFQEQLTKKTDILIYGCGPSLEETVNKILREQEEVFFNSFINITADGAAVFLRELGIKIDAIFTDLDGITKKEFNYSDFNIVHAHGDNIDKLKIFGNDIINFHNIIGTTQVEPLDNVINPGGFTDGDRIIYFLHKLINPSQKLFLIGMDFQNIIGKYSKLEFQENLEGTMIKKKKLQYGIMLLEWIIPKIKNEIYFVNSKKISKKFNYISIEHFLQIVKHQIL